VTALSRPIRERDNRMSRSRDVPDDEFAGHFRELVAPRLKELCRRQGVLVAMELETFTGAQAVIVREARRFGSGYLPPAVLDDLLDKIAIWLLKCIEKAEADKQRLTAEIEAQRKADPAGFYRWLIPNDRGLRHALKRISDQAGRAA
jgi:hypothetical protein